MGEIVTFRLDFTDLGLLKGTHQLDSGAMKVDPAEQRWAVR